MQVITNPFQAVAKIFIKPNGVFQTLGQVNNWSWIPFLLISCSSIGLVYFYFAVVDFDWYREMLVNQKMTDVSPAEVENFRNSLSPKPTQFISVFMVFLIHIIWNAIFAVYLNVVAQKDRSHVHGYTDWYGLLWWTQLPTLINVVIAFLLILAASDHQISHSIMGPLSISFLFGLDVSSKWFDFGNTLRLDTIWSIYLLTVGISQWTAFSGRKALLIAAAPTVIFGSIRALFIIFG